VFVDSLSLFMVLNVFKSHINIAVTLFYACYITAETVIWAIQLAIGRPIVHLICYLGPPGRQSLYLQTHEIVQSGNSLSTWLYLASATRAAELVTPTANSQRLIKQNRDTRLYRWVLYRIVWRSTRNDLEIDQSNAIDRLVTTTLESWVKFNLMHLFMDWYFCMAVPGSCTAFLV
jgi:hypothetical protein